MPYLEKDIGFKMELLLLRQRRQSCVGVVFTILLSNINGCDSSVTVDDCRIIYETVAFV